MHRHIHWKSFILNLFIPLAVGGLSAFLTQNAMDLYQNIDQPPLAPPSWLFPIVWTILYILMGISTYRIQLSDSNTKTEALMLYALQLLLNFTWPLIFFLGQNFLIAFIVLVFLWYAVFQMIQAFYTIDPLAAILQIPYLVWLTFAGYLNLMIYFRLFI